MLLNQETLPLFIKDVVCEDLIVSNVIKGRYAELTHGDVEEGIREQTLERIKMFKEKFNELRANDMLTRFSILTEEEKEKIQKNAVLLLKIELNKHSIAYERQSEDLRDLEDAIENNDYERILDFFRYVDYLLRNHPLVYEQFNEYIPNLGEDFIRKYKYNKTEYYVQLNFSTLLVNKVMSRYFDWKKRFSDANTVCDQELENSNKLAVLQPQITLDVGVLKNFEVLEEYHNHLERLAFLIQQEFIYLETFVLKPIEFIHFRYENIAFSIIPHKNYPIFHLLNQGTHI